MAETGLVGDWYNQHAALEHDHLHKYRLEFEVSLRTILKVLDSLKIESNEQVKILDLGGGKGRYAIELAKRGHAVTLSDISTSELDLAAVYAKENSVELAGIIPLDARDVRNNALVFRENHYDMILCQGPLYHLLEEFERVGLLEDCTAMVKLSGFVLAAFVTKYAHLRDVAQRDPGRLAANKEFYRGYLATGRYERDPKLVSYHTDPAEIRGLFAKVQGEVLRLKRLVACEGFLGGGLSTGLDKVEGEAYEAWVDLVMGYVEDSYGLGAADHLLTVSQRV